MLEIWEARRLERRLPTGKTKPAVLECVLSGPEGVATRLMVVKAMGPTEVTETGLICEMFGNLVARELGVRTPECAIVNISPQVADAIRPFLDPPGFQSGFGVGSEFMRGGMTGITPFMTLLAEELDQATRLYAFDLLVQNPDRRKDNPNCAYLGKDIYAYDFEMCFTFLLPVLAQVQPWEVSHHMFAKNHVFYNALHHKDIDWRPFVQDVARLTEEGLMQMVSRLPMEWRSKTQKVCAHLLAVAAHTRELEMELERSIA